MKCIIYKATFRNGKSYIGQTTTDLKVRISNHLYKSLTKKSNLLFHNAIRKYGFENVTWKIIKESKNWDDMQEDEKSLIVLHGTRTPLGYNTTEGGGQLRHSDATKKKLSDMKKGNKNYNFGIKHTSEHIKRISDGVKSAWKREGVKEKFIKARTGIPHTEVQNKNISISQKKRWERKKLLLNQKHQCYITA